MFYICGLAKRGAIHYLCSLQPYKMSPYIGDRLIFQDESEAFEIFKKLCSESSFALDLQLRRVQTKYEL